MEEQGRYQERSAVLAELRQQVFARAIDRRDFMKRAAALGLSSSLAATIFATYSARPVAAGSGARSGSVAARRYQDDLANATPGGTMRFARAEDSTNFDTVVLPLNVDIWIVASVYEQLVRIAPNGVDLEPGVAESWELSPDSLTYTFHLRPGVMFSDGSPMKASDVIYTLDRARTEPTQAWTFTLAAVQDVAAPDDATVVITLSKPWAPFLADIAMFNSSILSEAWTKGNEERLVNEMFGTGPFMLTEWKKEEYLLLKKNPHYWDEGLPLLDEIKISKVPDDNNRILQLQSGEIDAMQDVPWSRVAELESDANLQVIRFPSSYTQYVTLNHGVPPLDDLNVRLALNHAVDRQAVIDIVLAGNGDPATTFVPKDMLYWNNELPGFPFDLAKAQEYLANSPVPNGFELELSYLGGVVEYEQLATTLKDMWSQIGVNVTITPMEQGVYYDSWFNETYQSHIIYWTNDIVDPDQVCSAAVLPEVLNAFHTAWMNEEAIELTRAAPSELDPAKRKEIYFRIQEIFNEDSPSILVYYKPLLDAMTKKIHNFIQPPTGQFNWKATWIEQ
jgi:peptide/nickel transport system substrate-binding protein